MSLLESLLIEEDVRVVAIQDSTHCNGRLLLKCLLTQWVERYPSVHVFLYEMEAHRWTNGLPPNITEKAKVHCGYSEYWSNEQQSSNLLKDFSAQEVLGAVGHAPLQDCAVIIDSISTLLLYHKLSHVVRSLKLLGSKVAALLFLVHGDLHDSHVMAELNHVTFTRILLKTQEPLDNLEGQKGSCSVIHCKKSGRVIKKDQLYKVTEGYQLSGSEAEMAPAVVTQRQDPAANLTFSVSLSSKEKSDRAKTVLPYIRAQQSGKEGGGGGGGHIHYCPDESDDIDHSDPDDDLDI